MEEQGIVEKILSSDSQIEPAERVRQAVISYAQIHSEKWGEVANKLKNMTSFQQNESSEYALKIGFSYLKDTKETKKLFKGYMNSEKKISKLLKKKNYIEKTLHRFD